jgi:hypothetical protein
LNLNVVKPKPKQIYRNGSNGPLVEVVDVGMRYANVKTVGGDDRFKWIVSFNNLFPVEPSEVPAPPKKKTTRPTEAALTKEFLDE